MSDSTTDLADIDVAVLAGGLGTRISQVLKDTPKLLAPVEGRPLVDYLFDWLRGFGARRIVLLLGHLAGKVADHLDAHPPHGLSVEWAIEPSPLGTAGALVHGRALLRSNPVMVLNGDSFVDADLSAFVASHKASAAPASLLCTQVPDAARFGRVMLDQHGRIARFAEKDPANSGPGLINAGVYLLGQSFLDQIVAAQARSLELDVFARQSAGTLGAHAGAFPFIDIGTPESLANAAASMLRPCSGH